MAKKISQLPLTTAVSGADAFEVTQGGVSKRMEAQSAWTLGSLVITDGRFASADGVNHLFGSGTRDALRVIHGAAGAGIDLASVDSTGSATFEPLVVTADGILLNSTAGGITFTTASTNRWIVSTAGHLLTGSDNAYDIGASGATRPRAGYFGTSVHVGNSQLNSNTVIGAWDGLWLRQATPAVGNYFLLSDGAASHIINYPDAYTLIIRKNNGGIWQFDTGGHFKTVTDNAVDIGAAGATRPRTGYFATSVVCPLFTSTGELTVAASGGSNGIAFKTNGTTTQFTVAHLASAVNNLEVVGAVTTGAPVFRVIGEANVAIRYRTKGNGTHVFEANNTQDTIGFQIGAPASSVNWLRADGATTGNRPALATIGSDTNISMLLIAKGTGGFNFFTNAGTAEQLRIVHIASAVNFVHIQGGATGVTPAIRANGSDTNVSLAISSQGTGGVQFQTGTFAAVQAQVIHTASATRHVTLTGSNGGNPAISVSAGALALGAASTDIQWLRTNIALGGGAAPTLGTIGGSGPATAAQRNWLRFIESDGTASFIPVWR